MKPTKFIFIAIVALASLGFISLNMEETPLSADPERNTMTDSVLRHVVLFKFKDDVPQEKITEIEQAFSALPSKISQIADYEWGINNSPEGLNKGLTHCFFVTFKSEADREIYLPHPDHQAFVQLLGPSLEDVTVVDYWTK
ncbi:MAG: Dabb family protein [Eudoraea sp.]|nr:Dabb family protein [Eudoraea sp.]